MSVPSAAEIEHADWPTLQGICRSLGLNPKGRSGVVRMRVLEHVRRRGRPESWRAGRDHMAAFLTRLGFPDLAEGLWVAAIRLDAPGPWVGLGQAHVAGAILSQTAWSLVGAIPMGDTYAPLNRADARPYSSTERAKRSSFPRTRAGTPRSAARRSTISASPICRWTSRSWRHRIWLAPRNTSTLRGSDSTSRRSRRRRRDREPRGPRRERNRIRRCAVRKQSIRLSPWRNRCRYDPRIGRASTPMAVCYSPRTWYPGPSSTGKASSAKRDGK